MRRFLVVLVSLAWFGCGDGVANHLPPGTIIDQGPAPLTNVTHTSITFHADGDADGFACTLDGQVSQCASPFVADLAEGAHHFEVRAVLTVASAAQDADATPAIVDWTIDTTSPDTTIVSAPPSLDSTATETIAFTGTDGTVSFECALDAAAFAACTSPAALAPGDGAHTFQVRAIDGAGNVDPSPAQSAWTLDTTLPDTAITAGPTDGSTVGAATELAFSSANVDPATFECSLDGAAFAACTSPVDLTLADGGHTFAVRALDVHGIVDPSPATRAWTVDATPPSITIDSHPSDPSNDVTPDFTFSSTDATAMFQCKIDGGLAACTSPFTGAATDGLHTFTVVATDPVGNSASASFTWTINTDAPTVVITSQPPNPSNTATGTFAFTTTAGTTQCGVDGGALVACASPFTTGALLDGSHTIVVQATDSAGNVGSATATWVIDTVAPTVAFTTTPTNPTNSTAATFAFTTSEPATTQCKLDAGAFAACTSPKALAGLADGSHTFTVKATDAAGNAGSSAFTWVIDTSAPTVTINTKPTNPSNTATGTFTFTVSDGAIACKVDGGGFATCASPFTTGTLADGSHTFTVHSTDTAGNIGTASFTWVIDTAAPTVTINTKPTNPSNTATGTFTFTVSDGAIACKLDGGGFATCASPFTTGTLADGSHTFTVHSTDTAGNIGTASFTWVIDTAAPTVTINTKPTNPSNTATGTFTFTVSDGAIACKVDGGGFATCASPFTTGTLADGSHTFTVQATDTAGNVGNASFTWVIDTSAPTVTINTKPTNPSNTATGTFTFTVSDGAIACKVDGGGFATCASPFTTGTLADGSHTFTVHSTDTAGNIGTASFTWVIDTAAPTVTINTKPTNPSNTATGAFTFTVSDGAIACKLDGGGFATCASPFTTGTLADGSHTFTVQATDTAGNVGNASFTWVIDTSAPTVTINTKPANPSNTATGTFTFTVSDGAIACKVDGGGFATCASPFTTGTLADGSHTFTVQATDTAGNIGTASFTWVIDTAAPTVTINTKPTNPSNTATSTFTFTVSDGAIACKVDGGGFATCASPFTTGTLADGSHTFTVQATDTAGNIGTASFTWVIDTAAPTVTINTKPTNPSNTATGTFTFTVSDGAIACKVDGGGFATCASPFTTGTLADGSHTFTVHSTDTAGNIGTASFTWVIDTAAPTVTINTKPTNPSNTATGTFTFTVSDGAIACKVDGGGFATCASPFTTGTLADGSHTFTVHSTDTAGNIGTASFTWVIDTAAPTVTINTKPTNPSNTATGTFTFTVSDGAIACKVDGGGFATCASPFTTGTLADGSHTFTVQATDTAGNTGNASFTWTVDTTAPTVTLTSTPTNPTNLTTGTFAFTTSETSTTQCKIDAGAFAACTSPKSFTGLADGSHTVSVRATDTAGNVGTAATFTWTVDTTAPTVTITSGPPSLSNSKTATFTFTVSDGAIACKVDGGSFATCASPFTTASLADGSHTFTVHATDTAGNVGSASQTWTIDTTPPTVVLDDSPPAEWPVNYYDMLFHSPETGVTLACSLNGGAFAACSSPDTITTPYGKVSSFVVRATDAAGNSSTATASWTSSTGLVLHYGWEQGATHDTGLLSQRPSYSPGGSVATLPVVGGWAGTALVSPAATTFQTTRPLTSSDSGTYTASVWVIPQKSPTTGGVIWSNQSATAGIKLSLSGTQLTMDARENTQDFQVNASLTSGRWANITVVSTSPGKGAELFVNGTLIGTALLPTKTGFDADQAQLTVGALTGGTVVDELRFYNLAESATEQCDDVLRGTFNVNGACVPNIPGWDLRFDGSTFADNGNLGVAVNAPSLFSVSPDTLGDELGVGSAGGLSISGLGKTLPFEPEHTVAFWFQSGTAQPSDTLLDFTTQCVAGKPGNCGISVKYTAPSTLTVFAGSASANKTITITIPTAGFHSVVVDEQRVAGAPVTKDIQVFVDGVASVISIGAGDVYATISDTAIMAGANGSVVDEYRFFPRDLSADPEMLCENGFGGEFDVVTDSCNLTAN